MGTGPDDIHDPDRPKHFSDFAEEAARLRDETLRRYGASPDSPVQAMSLSRKKAIERLQGLEEAVLYHLDDHIPSTIGKAPTAVNHWRMEVNGFLDKMEALSEHVGGKTSVEWRTRIGELRRRAVDLLGASDE